nr:unnamed protein product [Callosobruchus analis]
MVAFKPEIQTHSSLLKQISNHVNTKYEELMLSTKNYDLRQKRGIFNDLGTVWKLITGNLDATDGQYFASIKLHTTSITSKDLCKNKFQ